MKLSTYPNRIKRAKIKNYSLLILLLVISQVNTQESLVGCFLVTDTNDTIAVMNHVDTWNDPWENCIPACHAADYKYAAIQFGLCTCRQSLNNTATLNSSLCQSIALSPLTYDYFNDSNRLNIFEYQNITEFKEAKNFKLELNLFKYSNIDIKTDAKFILIAADQKILQDWTSVDQFNSTILNFGYKSLVLSVSNSYISKSPQSMIFVNKVYDSLKSSKLVCHRFYCLDCLVRCDLITIGSSVSVYLSHNGTELVDRNFTTQDSELDSYGNYVPFFIKSPPVPQLKNPNYVSVKRTGIVRVIEFYYVPASNESVKLIFWAGKIEPNGEKKISKKSSPVELKTTGYVFVDFPFDEDFEVESYWTIGWECVESRYLNLVNEDLMRVFISIPSVTSVFFRANKLGNQTVETFIEGDISLNQTIDVVNKLQKVEIIILDECASGKSCIFLAKIYPSTYIGIISYLWKLECPIISLSLSLQTQDPLLNYTFPADCECDVTLNVNNVVTFKNVSERIKVLTIIKPIKLFSESGMSKKISASVEGEKAMIRFTYEDGTQYNCDIDFGDDSTLQFSELSTIQWNNTIFEHIYRKAGWYNLSIVCENLLNKLSYSTAHFVEKKIKKIELNSNHTLTNTPFQLEFKIDGSNPVSDLKFNGVSVHNIQYDNYTGLVKSRFAGLPVNIYEIILRVENLVSSMEFRGWFQSGFPISGPTLRIQGQNTIFEFTSYVVYYVDFEKGSNINIKVFYGDEVDEENPTIDLQLSGVWTKPLVLNHTHTIPGTFRVRVLVSNFFNSFTMYQNVTILTNCFDLLPILENKPVINTPAGSLAFFRFSYLRHKAGADAFVKFWPGDAKNESHGPYPLGMNYHTNTTQNALFYSYIYDGNYNASFQVYNTISSANYSLEVQVVRSVFGLTLDTNKKYLNVNDSFEVYAYMIQATSDTKFDFEFLGKKITIPRLSKELKTPDSVKFDPVEAVGNYTVKVRAYDQYSEISAILLIQVQQPITDVTFVTTNFVVARSVNYYRVTSTMIAFELNYSGMPTNPFYTIDFDDGGVVENPKYLENQNSFLVHFYEHANIYNVNVTVMNKVSSVSRIAKVKILNEFIDFKCVPKWRAVDVAIAKEYEYSAVDGVYMVSFDYQLRLHCTWKTVYYQSIAIPRPALIGTSISSASISVLSVSKGSRDTPIETISLFDALSNATIIHISDPYSLTKIPDGLIIIITTNQLFDLFTNQSSLIHVNYSNTLFTGSIPLHIKPVPSVKISGIITNITAVQPDDRVMFSIQEPKLSEPSCALISISVNQGPDQFLFSTGTSIIECSKYFKSIIYSGPYTLTGNNSWIIETVLKDQGLITVKVILKNIVSESNSSITLPVTKVPCYPPQVTIASAAKLFYEPKNHFRSDLLSISASIIFNCNNQASYIKTWLLFKADPSTGNNLSDSISLENNPTNSYLELVIGAKWLKPGLYRFVLLVNTTTSSGISFVSDSFTFVKIVPSGMNVAAFGGGVSEVIIGTRQECIFKPAEHSTDYDNSSNMSELEFKFYCKVVDSLSDQGYPSSSLGQLTDLKSLGDSGEILDADKVCFKRSRDFSVYNNTLIIAKKALKFKENRIYRFLITTTLPYSEKVYSQEVDLIVKDINRMLSVQIGCSPAFTCFKFNEVLIINPNSQIIMDGQCKTDCGSYVVYTWQLYAAFKIGLKTIWSPIKVSENLIQDQHKNKLVLSPEFFSTYTNVSTEWKVELRINSETTRYGPLNGYSSLVIAVNQLPVNGSCSVWPINGIAMLTDFNVICSGWIDPDGEIERYEFYAAYIDAKVDISVGLGYNKLGLLKSLRLQRGVLKIWVRVKDMAGGSVDYTIDELILVELNDAFESTIMSWDSDVSFWFAGSTQNILKIATSIIQYLNSANSNYTLESLNSTSNITTRRIYLRSFVFQQLSEASISDMSSMKMWAGLLAEATSVSSEMTIDSSLIAVKACSNLVKALEDLVRKSAFDEVRDITMGVGSSVSSVVDSLNSIQKRTNSTSELLISSFNTANSLMDRLTGLLSMRLGLGQLVQVKASQMEMRVMKMSAENVEGNVSNEFEIPSFCEMAKDNCGSDRAVVVQAKVGTVAPGLDGSGTVGLSLMNEDNSLISVKNSTQFIAVKVPRPIGFKLPDFEVVNVGNISSNISNSSSDRVLLKGPFYMSAFRIEVPMSAIFVHISPMNLSLGYFFWINRGGLPYYNQTVKVYEKIEFFCPNNLRPDDENEAMFYQFFMNMSETNNFTGILGFGLREMSDDELTFNCFNLNRTHENIIEPAFREVVYFTADFRLRSFTANCLFYDETNNKWSSDGVEILEHTDNKYTHCVSTHLTSFGGGISGLTILPPTINFASVFAKADFMSNQTIYITLIVTTSLLILLCIFARYKDNLDKLTIGLAILPENNPDHNYFYELIVFTGSRPNSSTDSEISFILSGEKYDSGVRRLYDPERQAFRSGGVDSFIMSNEKPLFKVFLQACKTISL